MSENFLLSPTKHSLINSVTFLHLITALFFKTQFPPIPRGVLVSNRNEIKIVLAWARRVGRLQSECKLECLRCRAACFLIIERIKFSSAILGAAKSPRHYRQHFCPQILLILPDIREWYRNRFSSVWCIFSDINI